MDFSSDLPGDSDLPASDDVAIAIEFAMLVERDELHHSARADTLNELATFPITDLMAAHKRSIQAATRSFVLAVEATRDETNPRSLLIDFCRLDVEVPTLDRYANVSAAILLDSADLYDELIGQTTSATARDEIRYGVALSLLDAGAIEHAFSVVDEMESPEQYEAVQIQVALDAISRFRPETALMTAHQVNILELKQDLLELAKTISFAMDNPASLDDAMVMLDDNRFAELYPQLVASAYIRETAMRNGCYVAREAMADLISPKQRTDAMRTLAEVAGSIGSKEDRRFVLTELASHVEPGERYQLAAAYALGCGVMSQEAAFEQLRLILPTSGGYDSTEWLHAYYAKGALRSANEGAMLIQMLLDDAARD